jgi:hypothetical protein
LVDPAAADADGHAIARANAAGRHQRVQFAVDRLRNVGDRLAAEVHAHAVKLRKFIIGLDEGGVSHGIVSGRHVGRDKPGRLS